jgi:hypothetical protein
VTPIRTTKITEETKHALEVGTLISQTAVQEEISRLWYSQGRLIAVDMSANALLRSVIKFLPHDDENPFHIFS